jgi:hypothetical protein
VVEYYYIGVNLEMGGIWIIWIIIQKNFN